MGVVRVFGPPSTASGDAAEEAEVTGVVEVAMVSLL
jgi:hypothetical protein